MVLMGPAEMLLPGRRTPVWSRWWWGAHHSDRRLTDRILREIFIPIRDFALIVVSNHKRPIEASILDPLYGYHLTKVFISRRHSPKGRWNMNKIPPHLVGVLTDA